MQQEDLSNSLPSVRLWIKIRQMLRLNGGSDDEVEFLGPPSDHGRTAVLKSFRCSIAEEAVLKCSAMIKNHDFC